MQQDLCPTLPNTTPICAGSACGYTCAPGFLDCDGPGPDGCEVNGTNDVNNCGSCGNKCAMQAETASVACAGSACKVTTCNAGYADCNGVYGDGCEVDTGTDNNNCGKCGAPCTAGLVCKNGVCAGSALFTFQASQVIDGQTVTCASVVNTATYTECDNLLENGLYFPNGVGCGPIWSTTNSQYSDTVGFCASLTGASGTSGAESYYVCNTTQQRTTWKAHVWGTFMDNGYTQNVRCVSPSRQRAKSKRQRAKVRIGLLPGGFCPFAFAQG